MSSCLSQLLQTVPTVVRELKLADDAGKTVTPVRLANIKASGDFAYFLVRRIGSMPLVVRPKRTWSG